MIMFIWMIETLDCAIPDNKKGIGIINNNSIRSCIIAYKYTGPILFHYPR